MIWIRTINYKYLYNKVFFRANLPSAVALYDRGVISIYFLFIVIFYVCRFVHGAPRFGVKRVGIGTPKESCYSFLHRKSHRYIYDVLAYYIPTLSLKEQVIFRFFKV